MTASKRRFEVDLWEMLCESVKNTQAIGTCTFVMALIDEEDPLLRGLNLGDSGYMILRKNKEGEPL